MGELPSRFPEDAVPRYPSQTEDCPGTAEVSRVIWCGLKIMNNKGCTCADKVVIHSGTGMRDMVHCSGTGKRLICPVLIDSPGRAV